MHPYIFNRRDADEKESFVVAATTQLCSQRALGWAPCLGTERFGCWRGDVHSVHGS